MAKWASIAKSQTRQAEQVPGRCKCGKSMFRLKYREGKLIRICRSCGAEQVI